MTSISEEYVPGLLSSSLTDDKAKKYAPKIVKVDNETLQAELAKKKKKSKNRKAGPSKGKMQITGKLGDVMQESVKAAKSYIRSKSLDYGIIPPIFDKKDFHIHVPEGATPKDGPSAGTSLS